MTATTFDAAGVPIEKTVPPPLRGWLVAFAVMRVYAATSAAHALYQLLVLTPSWLSADVRAQLSRMAMLSVLWFVLELVGLVLLLRRDGYAPAYWMGLLLVKLGWLLVTVLPQRGTLTHVEATIVVGVLLPGVWLALWTTSPLVARTFGPAAERWRPSPPRALSAGTILAAIVLALLWLAALAVSVWVNGSGEWKTFVFMVYTALALPLWIITWLWARQHGAAVEGSGWLPLGWIVVALAPLAARLVDGVIPAAALSLLRGLDLTRMVPGIAFALAMYTIGRAVRGRSTPLAPAADAG